MTEESTDQQTEDSQDYTWKAKVCEDKVETNGTGFWAVHQGDPLP